ncbi:MAG: ABC transporter permease, partial [Dehalococcoidia bacterium]|nr:ABC transporter permease [Dehalococcoidia bacterium]
MAVRATALLERRASVRVVWGLVVCGYFSAAVLAPVLFTYEEAVRVDLRQALEAPGPESWLGRDELGRRVDARIVWGARNSLTVSGVGVLLGGGLGVLVGTV